MNEKIRNLQRRSLNPSSSSSSSNTHTLQIDDDTDEEDDTDYEDYDGDDDDLGDENIEIDLNKVDINRVYDETRSASNFCVQLMLKIFKKQELFNHNVYGRIFKPTNSSSSGFSSKNALDEIRIDFIREKMFSFYPSEEKKRVWSKCVKAMNDKICYLQKANRLNNKNISNNEEDENQQLNESRTTSNNGEDEQNDTIYKDKLSQEDINYLYRSTISPQNFAVRLMLKCFDSNELSKNKNVYGRIYKKDVKQKKALDESRIDFIRETVFRYYPDEVKRSCWPKCIKSMNDKIRYINSK
jgi:hypothetical protein